MGVPPSREEFEQLLTKERFNAGRLPQFAEKKEKTSTHLEQTLCVKTISIQTQTIKGSYPYSPTFDRMRLLHVNDHEVRDVIKILHDLLEVLQVFNEKISSATTKIQN